jgi:hypothetical protein
METNGARNHTGRLEPYHPRPLPRINAAQEPPPVHDLLVMSHGPDVQPDDRANHACLNSLARSSWIMSAGG